MTIDVIESDCLEYLNSTDRQFSMIYIDPPFMSQQKRTTNFTDYTYDDTFPSLSTFLEWMIQVLRGCHRVLFPQGTIFVHVDYRTVAHLKVTMDSVFGGLINWVIWNYNSGGASKKSFAKKHDDILWYRKGQEYTFNVVREPYPRDYGDREGFHPEGRVMQDVWQIPILSTTSNRRTGYPSQKPDDLLERIVSVSTKENEWVLDPMAGSGTTGEVSQKLGRNVVLVDKNPQAIEVMHRRLGQWIT